MGNAIMYAVVDECRKEREAGGHCRGDQYLFAEKQLYDNLGSEIGNIFSFFLVVSILGPLLLSTYLFSYFAALGISLPRHFVWELYALLATFLIGRLFVRDLQDAAVRIARSAHRDERGALSKRLRDLLAAKDSSSLASTLLVFIALQLLVAHYYYLDVSETVSHQGIYFGLSMGAYAGYMGCYLLIFMFFGRADLLTVKISPDYYNASSFWYYFMFSDLPAILVLTISLILTSITFATRDVETILSVKTVIGGIIWMQVVFSNILTGVVSYGGHRRVYRYLIHNVAIYARRCQGGA
jgi:hypothetical protein